VPEVLGVTTPQQERRAALEDERKRLRRRYLDANPFCQMRVTATCRRRAREATDVHEIVSRGRGGSFVDQANFLGACRWCHQIVTNFPAFAEAIGASLPSWARGQASSLTTARRMREAWIRDGWASLPMLYLSIWTGRERADVERSIEAARVQAERL
jgi:hypothetical protein